MKRAILILLCLLAVGAAWLFWLRGGASAVKKSTVTAAPVAAVSPAATNQLAAAGKAAKAAMSSSTNLLAFRLTNTKKTLAQLIGDQRAILLQNAFIDTAASLGGLKIPDNLKSKGDPGAYIVQARGPISAAFRAALQAAGAQVVSYIPNNAYLVQMNASSAGMMSGNALVQAVLPYEPYYKLQPSLLAVAAQADPQPLPPGVTLTLGLFNSTAAATEPQLNQDGFVIVGKAGQLLTRIIQATGLSRADVYIANILKCRPDTPGQDAGNRKPTSEEMATCIPYLHEQIDLIRPKVLVALGATAVEGLLGKTIGITKLRGNRQT